MTLLALVIFAAGIAYALKRDVEIRRPTTVSLQKRAARVSAMARSAYDAGLDPNTVIALQRASATLYAAARQSAFHS